MANTLTDKRKNTEYEGGFQSCKNLWEMGVSKTRIESIRRTMRDETTRILGKDAIFQNTFYAGFLKHLFFYIIPAGTETIERRGSC